MTDRPADPAAQLRDAGAVTFDCFGTLVRAARPENPASAVAAELEAAGIDVPSDWEAAYRTRHVDVEDGAELALSRHVAAALESRGVDYDRERVAAAVFATFDRPVEQRAGAADLCRGLREAGTPRGVISNCSVEGLVPAALERAGLAVLVDVVVTSVGCGHRKPEPAPFEAAAGRLGVAGSDLVHVGDDPVADGGAAGVGATPVILDEVTLPALATPLEGATCR